ncbi:sigma-70 family RNA polymerase sigma factor [Streptomyces sp. NPDC048172]|uniref:sigma-70 family RNA polymerase sigma factor n=1 Tax=Streptomyces sp. NPDC048172 TaxID=3365505 RepID=UPI003724002B
MENVDWADVVAAARDGDRTARERLAAEYLPLVYNVVGRALDGHADVDDVVQETMLRALDGLGDLRDLTRFRSWLIAIAMNQVRTRWSARRQQPAPLAELGEHTDPATDFADLTILRLQLSGQRREVAEATRWLDDDDRDVLSLWWLESSGELTRAELAEALGLPNQHATVRVHRVKQQLALSRAVVRALAAEPRCPELASLTDRWDGVPSPLWRKRIARHVRDCGQCAPHSRDQMPVEGLLAGIGLVLPLYEGISRFVAAQAATATTQTGTQAAAATVSQTTAQTASHAASHSASQSTTHALFHGKQAAGLIAAGSAAAVALAVLVWPSPPAERDEAKPSPRPASSSPAPASPSPSPSRAKPSPSTETARAAAPAPRPKPTSSSPRPPRTKAPSKQTRLVRQINVLRARQGCTGLRTDPRLTRVAQRQAEEMAARDQLGHTDASGRDLGQRVSAAGYEWSAVGETVATQQGSPKAVASEWQRSAMRDNEIFNCDFQHAGVGLAESPNGPYWTQVLATPR